jgi:alpha-galactosidase/6-phospho-beta-glucosidase family protein
MGSKCSPAAYALNITNPYGEIVKSRYRTCADEMEEMHLCQRAKLKVKGCHDKMVINPEKENRLFRWSPFREQPL